uniref:C2H2-type domain-containing protein n=1 Tax=Nothobranchius furzeri TaxID=105023 RepID=A0A8C6LV46_NOTFU
MGSGQLVCVAPKIPAKSSASGGAGSGTASSLRTAAAEMMAGRSWSSALTAGREEREVTGAEGPAERGSSTSVLSRREEGLWQPASSYSSLSMTSSSRLKPAGSWPTLKNCKALSSEYVSQLQLKEEETDATRLPFTTASIKSEDDEEKPLSANKMTAETSRNSDLNHHQQTSDSSQTEVSGDDEDIKLSDSTKQQKSFSCDDCGRIFRHEKPFNRHKDVHAGQKPVTCKVCGQRLRNIRNLKSHMSLHTGQKPFACDLCDQRFSNKAFLNSHMSFHTGYKPFACELSTLVRHMRVHTGEKPFSCELCGKRFNQKTSLNRHMRLHTGQMPIACDICGQRFRYKMSLNDLKIQRDYTTL